MRIELPESKSAHYFEFVGGALTRHPKFSHWRGDTELIARLDRGEVLEIGGEDEKTMLSEVEQARRVAQAAMRKIVDKHPELLDWSQDAGPQEPLGEIVPGPLGEEFNAKMAEFNEAVERRAQAIWSGNR